MSSPDFPVTPLLPEIRDALASTARLVLEAPTGAGKTTQVPLALLDAGWLGTQRIVLLEPRRIAARAAAGFMARQLGEKVGQTVGYRIRFESKVTSATRIEVVTEGILTRMLQSDPGLDGIGAVLFDEFHERHLAGDLGLALALDVQAGLREDLRIVLMSATLDGERIAAWLDAPRVSSPGRSFPVQIEYPPARSRESPEQHLARMVPQALAEHSGEVLAFLPGQREIARVQRLLEHRLGDGIEVLPLHGNLPLDAQRAALAPAEPGTRRVVLATNVAESSVTLPGIRVVIDSGLAREPRFDPNSGFTQLVTTFISRASADQRAGRAGRVAPGVAWRLWPQSRRLETSRSPEIVQAELSTPALELAAWGSDDLRWLDTPPPGAMAQARELLQRLGALAGDGRITALGREMLKLGAVPRLAAAALRAPPAERALVADLLALLETRSPLRGASARTDDLRTRLTALHRWRDGGAAAARRSGADPGALSAIEQAARGWRKRLKAGTPASGTPHNRTLGNLLLHAYPDRVACRDENQAQRYRLANGRGACLGEHSQLTGEPWLVVSDLRLQTRDSLILTAAPFDPGRLQQDFPERFVRERVLEWDADRDAVQAFAQQRFDAIILERRRVPVSADDALPALLAAVRAKGLDALPWSDPARSLRLRVQCLREWMPELDLPDLGDAALLRDLEDWLAPFLVGKRRLDALDPGSLSKALAARMDYARRRQLDALVPIALTVPSGRSRCLEYRPGQAPVLAVKLQELFGLADTPRVAEGRIAVTLQLLSPAGRPMQVTQDLAGFWQRTYPEVRKELKGRYPKHPWPEDPWTAVPTHRTARKKRD